MGSTLQDLEGLHRKSLWVPLILRMWVPAGAVRGNESQWRLVVVGGANAFSA